MWENRQLFQAGPWRVQLGQSPCNEHCYSVWVRGVPFMICSNNFWQECRDETARKWVEANICYTRWDVPTWVADGHAQGPSAESVTDVGATAAAVPS
jgi:hypothetical protein